MIINNINISEFGGKVQSKSFSDSPIVKSATWLLNAPKPLVIGENKGFKSLSLKLLFQGSSRNDVNNKINSFMAQVSECDIKFKNLEHYYHCYYESSNREETKIDEWLFVTINFICYEYDEEKTFNFNGLEEFAINNIGTDVTPAILEITPNINLANITIEGLADDPIIIKNLNVNKKIILDGELQKITVDKINKYGDTEMWDFPKLNPGINLIKVNRNTCNIKIKYKPRFV